MILLILVLTAISLGFLFRWYKNREPKKKDPDPDPKKGEGEGDKKGKEEKGGSHADKEHKSTWEKIRGCLTVFVTGIGIVLGAIVLLNMITCTRACVGSSNNTPQGHGQPAPAPPEHKILRFSDYPNKVIPIKIEHKGGEVGFYPLGGPGASIMLQFPGPNEKKVKIQLGKPIRISFPEGNYKVTNIDAEGVEVWN